MIAPLGSRIAQSDEKFVRLQGKVESKKGAQVCHKAAIYGERYGDCYPAAPEISWWNVQMIQTLRSGLPTLPNKRKPALWWLKREVVPL